jgi:hypothetical protein
MPIENIFIITAVSSNEWMKQTKERMPESIRDRIYHRGQLLTKFVDDIKGKKNILIIMDEIQVAAKRDQTIYNTFKSAGLLDKQFLYKNDIKILEYTATPDGTIYDLLKWNDASRKILAEEGNGYISAYDLYEMKRVKQYKPLCCYDENKDVDEKQSKKHIQEIKADIDKYDEPRYHIIRTKPKDEQKTIIKLFKKIFGKEECKFRNYDGDKNNNDDINIILEKKPAYHTFIFIKEMLRCAKTLTKKYIGILYERYSRKIDDAVVIQGLIGRDTGYDNNGKTIIYTNIDTIIRYEQLWMSQFEDTDIKWYSKTTKRVNGNTTGHNTFNDIKHYEDIDSESSEDDISVNCFTTYELAKQYWKDNLRPLYNGTGPTERKQREDGYYECTLDKITKVHSYDEIYKKRMWALNETHHYTFYPCYIDVNDKSTLRFCLIHKSL